MELVPDRSFETMKTTNAPPVFPHSKFHISNGQHCLPRQFSLLPAAFLSGILLLVPSFIATAQQQTVPSRMHLHTSKC